MRRIQNGLYFVSGDGDGGGVYFVINVYQNLC